MEKIAKQNLLKQLFGAVFLCLFFTLASGFTVRAQSVTVNYADIKSDYNCEFYPDLTCTIGGKRSITGAVVIPSNIIVKYGDGVNDINPGESKTYKVTKVTGFSNNKSITSVSISDGVQEINGDAFLNCTSLTGNLTIPDSVTKIGSQAFRGCVNLNGKLTLGKDLTEIPDSAFYECGFTGSLVLPDKITKIGYSAFYGCKGFTGPLTIPSSVTTMGNNAFAFCSGFNGPLTLPGTATNRQEKTFYGCSGLTAITIGSGITDITDDEFFGCSGLTGSLILPDTIIAIGTDAFRNCSGLTGTLTIPSKVTEIHMNTFTNCSGFTGLSLPSGITKIAAQAFDGCKGMTGTLVLPDSLQELNYKAFNGCGFTGDLTLPSGITYVDALAFGCPEIDGTLTITPNPTRHLMSDAFEGMYKVQTIINNSDSSILLADFIPEDDLVTYFLKSGTTEKIRLYKKKPNELYPNVYLGKGTYLRNGKDNEQDEHTHTLVKVAAKAPSGKTNGNTAYWYCKDCNKFFSDSAGKNEIVKDSWVILAKNKQFKDSKCNGRFKVTSQGSKNPTVTYIGCTAGNATSVTIPATTKYGSVTYKVTEVGKGALKGKTKVRKITVGKNVKKIGDKAFFGCKGATTIKLGKNVTTLGAECMGNCSSLTKLTLPVKTTNLGKKFITKCNKKLKLTIKSKKLTRETIKDGAFTGMTNKATVTVSVPKGMKNDYKDLFRDKGLGKNITVK